jgi:2,5-diamino-6-(ribosylamino)-4(3H)-pyrimidinone 5'-phosphate reductase
MSVDGKISTGNVDERDVDKDFPLITGIKEGLHQYYEIEQTTDLVSMDSGKVMAKVGSNIKKENVKKTDVSFIIVDNKPHLNDIGVNYFLQMSKVFYLVTTNIKHPAFKYGDKDNIKIEYYEKEIDFKDLFNKFKTKYGIDKITLQTGGTLNSVLLREGLIDKLKIVVAPALIGGINTMSLIGGESIKSKNDLTKIKAMKLTGIKELKDSYIELNYDIINETKI